MIKKVKNSFFTGLALILPTIITIFILLFLTNEINDRILNPIIRLSGFRAYNPYWTYIVKGASFLVIILLVTLIGLAARMILLRKFFGFWERTLAYVPMIGKIYLTIKEISRAFLGQGKYVFKQVVLVEYPRKGAFSIGLVTSGSCRQIQDKFKTEVVHLFLPTTPNPTNGFFLIVPKKEVIPLNISVADGFKLVVSGGTFSPPNKTT